MAQQPKHPVDEVLPAGWLTPPFAKMIRFFPPLVSGTLLAVIGVSLIGPGAATIAGHDTQAADYAVLSHIGLALGILLVVLFNRFLRGFASQIGTLPALATGLVVAMPMGLVHLDGVTSASWLVLASPFHFGPPNFPNWLQTVCGGPITITAILAFSLNLLFSHLGATRDAPSDGVPDPAPPAAAPHG
jgi:xanthine/uracil permease